jgi:hypothetical protein
MSLFVTELRNAKTGNDRWMGELYAANVLAPGDYNLVNATTSRTFAIRAPQACLLHSLRFYAMRTVTTAMNLTTSSFLGRASALVNGIEVWGIRADPAFSLDLYPIGAVGAGGRPAIRNTVEFVSAMGPQPFMAQDTGSFASGRLFMFERRFASPLYLSGQVGSDAIYLFTNEDLNGGVIPSAGGLTTLYFTGIVEYV